MSADFYARPGDPKVKEQAVDFVRRAFKVVAVDTLFDDGLAEDPHSVSKDIKAVIDDGPDALVAASRVKKLLGQVGIATATAVHEILVNIASEAAKRALFG